MILAFRTWSGCLEAVGVLPKSGTLSACTSSSCTQSLVAGHPTARIPVPSRPGFRRGGISVHDSRRHSNHGIEEIAFNRSIAMSYMAAFQPVSQTPYQGLDHLDISTLASVVILECLETRPSSSFVWSPRTRPFRAEQRFHIITTSWDQVKSLLAWHPALGHVEASHIDCYRLDNGILKDGQLHGRGSRLDIGESLGNTG